jgi:hypothetical protein
VPLVPLVLLLLVLLPESSSSRPWSSRKSSKASAQGQYCSGV